MQILGYFLKGGDMVQRVGDCGEGVAGMLEGGKVCSDVNCSVLEDVLRMMSPLISPVQSLQSKFRGTLNNWERSKT